MLPEHMSVKDVDTRWSSGHDQMEFFRVHTVRLRNQPKRICLDFACTYLAFEVRLADELPIMPD